MYINMFENIFDTNQTSHSGAQLKEETLYTYLYIYISNINTITTKRCAIIQFSRFLHFYLLSERLGAQRKNS